LFVLYFFFLWGWVLPKAPRPMFGLWFGLVFLFGLFCSCCWDGGIGMGVHVAT
jgi:hypothetical protein